MIPKLSCQSTSGMRKDIETIQVWLLEATKFNAEDFILKITGSKDAKEGFKKYLEQKGLDPNKLIENK